VGTLIVTAKDDSLEATSSTTYYQHHSFAENSQQKFQSLISCVDS